MNRRLVATLALAVASLAPVPPARAGVGPAGAHLRVRLRYTDGALELVRTGSAPAAPRRLSRERYGWRLETRDAGGTILDARTIRDPRRLHVEWIDPAGGTLGGAEILRDRVGFEVILPVNPSVAANLDVYDQAGELLASVALADAEGLAPGQPEAGGTEGVCSGGWATHLLRSSGDPANRLNVTFLGDGYTETQMNTYATHVNGTIDYLLTREPYLEYQDFLNFWRVDVISNESGADEPGKGIYRDTALDCSYDWGGTDRCLFCPSGPVQDAAGCVPETDEIIVVVNYWRYGGCAGDYSVYSGGHADSVDIAFHELGHSLAGLADEYGGGGAWGGGEHPDRNCSIHDQPTMAALETKWWYWLGDYGIWTYASCGGYDTGLHRPYPECEMRSLHRTLGAVCREEHVLDYHARVDPIDEASPAEDPTILQEESVTFSIVRVPPLSHQQGVLWSVDGEPAAGAPGDSLTVDGESVALGTHTVTVQVADPTAWVRSDPQGLMQSQRLWNLSVICLGQPNQYDSDDDGICEPGHGGRDCDDRNGDVWALPGEVRDLVFAGDDRTLSWTPPTDPGGVAGSTTYDTLRSTDPASFLAAVCLESDDGTDTLAVDSQEPSAGGVFHYLVRAGNACPLADGSLGADSAGLERAGRGCP